MTIQEQIEWWRRQDCDPDYCPYDSEVDGFLHTVEKLLAVYEAAIEVRNVQPRPITKRDRRFWGAIAAVKDS